MTLSSTTSSVSHTGNGTNKAFTYSFRIFVDSDLVVTQTDATTSVETTLTLTTDYTVAGAGDVSGGSITLTTAPASGDTITIERTRPLTQATDIRNQGSFFPEAHEDAFDHQVMLSQQHQRAIDRSVKVPTSDTTFNGTLPSAASSNKGSAMIVNAAGTGLDWSADLSNLSAALSDIDDLVDDISALGPIYANVVTHGATSNTTFDAAEATANTTAFQAALDSAVADVVYIPAGTYWIDAPLTVPANVSIFGDGKEASIVRVDSTDSSNFGTASGWTPTVTYDPAVFNFRCAAFDTLPALSADVLPEDNELTFATAHGLSAGDIVIINSQHYMASVKMTSGSYQVGETITGGTDGTTATVVGSMNSDGEIRNTITEITGADGSTNIWLVYDIDTLGNSSYPAGFRPDKNDAGGTTETVTGGTSSAVGACHMAGGDYCLYRPQYQDGEMLQVASVQSNLKVEVYGGCKRFYDKDIVSMFKITTPAKGSIRDVKIVGPRASGGPPTGLTISDATQANPVVVTVDSAATNGRVVEITGVVGMTELNGNQYIVSNASAGSPFTFELHNLAGTDVDGTGFTAYTSGGTAQQQPEDNLDQFPGAISVIGGDRVSIRECALEDFNIYHVQTINSLGTRMIGLGINQNFTISDAQGQDYGVDIANSQDTLILGCHINATRHAVSEGAFGFIAGRPNPKVVNTRVEGCVLRVSGDIGALGPKGNSEGSHYVGNYVEGGTAIAGEQLLITENVFKPIKAPSGNGTSFFGQEWAATSHTISNNKIYDTANNASLSNGVFRISPSNFYGSVRNSGPTIIKNNEIVLEGGANPASSTNTTGDSAAVFKLSDDSVVGFTEDWVIDISDNDVFVGTGQKLLDVIGGQALGGIGTLRFNDNSIIGGQIVLPNGGGKVNHLEFRNNYFDMRSNKCWDSSQTNFDLALAVELSANDSMVVEGNTIRKPYYGGLQVTWATNISKPPVVRNNTIIDFNSGAYDTGTDGHNVGLLCGANQLKKNTGGNIVAGTVATVIGVTAQNPAIVVANAHGFSNGNTIYLDNCRGMNTLNKKEYIVANASTNYFELTDLGGTNVNATALVGGAKTITGATQANPVVITATAHGLSAGAIIRITGVVGMTELNGNDYIVASPATNTFELTDLDSANVDGTGFTAYASGGSATPSNYEVNPTSGTAQTRSSVTPIDAFTTTDRPTQHHGYVQINSFDDAANNDTFQIAGYSGNAIQYYNDSAVAVTAPSITAATQANPVQITTGTAHGYTTGQSVYITGVVGMTEINDRSFVITLVNATNFTLDGEDGTGHTAYVSGGTATKHADIIIQSSAIVDNNQVISFDTTVDDARAAFSFNDFAGMFSRNRVAFHTTPTSSNWKDYFEESTLTHIGIRREVFGSEQQLDYVSTQEEKLSIDTEPGTFTLIDDQEGRTVNYFMNTDIFNGETAGTSFQFHTGQDTISVTATNTPAATSTVVTFGTAFSSGNPHVFTQLIQPGQIASETPILRVTATSTTDFTIQAETPDGSTWDGTDTITFRWLAWDIG